MTATLTRPTDQVTPVAPVVVCTSHTGQRHGFRIEFTRPGQPEAGVVFRSYGEVAMALNLSGQPITRDLRPARLAELVLSAVDRVGADRIIELSLLSRGITLLIMERTAAPWERERRQALWPNHRQQACTDASDRLIWAAKHDELQGGDPA